MREIRSSGSVEGVMRNHDPYSDRKRRSDSILAERNRYNSLEYCSFARGDRSA
jgi:hypothetical protein